MIGSLQPHRQRNSRWCDQCRHPSIGKHRRARFIWYRPGLTAVYLCTEHAEEVRRME